MNRNVAATIACLLALAAVGSASEIHLYFSHQGNNSAVPPEYDNGENPVYDGTPIYLWAQTPQGTIWNGLFLDLTVNTAVAPSPLYNPGTAPNTRWDPVSDLDFAGDNRVWAEAVTQLGLGNMLEPLIAPGFSIGEHWLVGEVSFEDFFDQEFLAIPPPPGLIPPQPGYPPGTELYFGFTPAGDPDGPIYGYQYGAISAYADIIPEPASLLLLGLAAPLLRRR